MTKDRLLPGTLSSIVTGITFILITASDDGSKLIGAISVFCITAYAVAQFMYKTYDNSVSDDLLLLLLAVGGVLSIVIAICAFAISKVSFYGTTLLFVGVWLAAYAIFHFHYEDWKNR